ncbi:MAG: hypothetical protein NTY22_02840 [Proteobacteria bacterium]|nr:hypothetical protein [Pseudomonadota bacterium]
MRNFFIMTVLMTLVSTTVPAQKVVLFPDILPDKSGLSKAEKNLFSQSSDIILHSLDQCKAADWLKQNEACYNFEENLPSDLIWIGTMDLGWTDSKDSISYFEKLNRAKDDCRTAIEIKIAKLHKMKNDSSTYLYSYGVDMAVHNGGLMAEHFGSKGSTDWSVYYNWFLIDKNEKIKEIKIKDKEITIPAYHNIFVCYGYNLNERFDEYEAKKEPLFRQFVEDDLNNYLHYSNDSEYDIRYKINPTGIKVFKTNGQSAY